MINTIRWFLAAEAAAFVAAALVHAGQLVSGYEHHAARAAESVIGGVLMIGLAATWGRPDRARTVGLAAQGFALLGTLVGVFTTIVGVGPRSTFDIVYHAAMVALLVWGLATVARSAPRAGA